ncbi:hypothetical protein DK37_28280 [Halomonas sp. SUBG004]|nr:hypothetical protein DK37_28280 [Halomonas sp. SUBG004]
MSHFFWHFVALFILSHSEAVMGDDREASEKGDGSFLIPGAYSHLRALGQPDYSESKKHSPQKKAMGG